MDETVTCYGGGAIAASIFGTIICIALLAIGAWFFYQKYWKLRGGKCSILTRILFCFLFLYCLLVSIYLIFGCVSSINYWINLIIEILVVFFVDRLTAGPVSGHWLDHFSPNKYQWIRLCLCALNSHCRLLFILPIWPCCWL